MQLFSLYGMKCVISSRWWLLRIKVKILSLSENELSITDYKGWILRGWQILIVILFSAGPALKLALSWTCIVSLLYDCRVPAWEWYNCKRLPLNCVWSSSFKVNVVRIIGRWYKFPCSTLDLLLSCMWYTRKLVISRCLRRHLEINMLFTRGP